VFKYCFIFIVLGQDTSTQGSSEGIHRCDKGSSGGRGKYKTIFKHKQFLIKSSKTTQLYTTKVVYKQFSCHHHIEKSFIVTNLAKINIF
jgi:hypothetical protein